MDGRQRKGKEYEARAARMLQRAGLTILTRNYSSRMGEIDLVCRDGTTLVFVEVRYRGNPRFASAAASIDGAKRRRLLNTAQFYLQHNHQAGKQACRIDVVAFGDAQGSGKDEIQWLKNAITL